jgi:hypothetical protein
VRHGKRTILVLGHPDERVLPMLLKRQIEGFAAIYASTHDVAAAMLSHMPSIMSVGAAVEGNNYLIAEDGARIAAGERVILDGTTGRLFLTPAASEPALIEDEPILVTPHDLVGSKIEQKTRDEYGHLSYEELLAAHSRLVAQTVGFIGERAPASLSKEDTLRYADLELVTHFIHIMIFERAKERGLSYFEAQLDVATADGSLDRVPGLEHKRIALARDGENLLLIVGTSVSYEHESIDSSAFDEAELGEILHLLKEDGVAVRKFTKQSKLSRHTQFVSTTCLEFKPADMAAVVGRLQQVESRSRA